MNFVISVGEKLKKLENLNDRLSSRQTGHDDDFGQKYRNIQSIQPDLPRPPVPIVHHNEPTFEGNL